MIRSDDYGIASCIRSAEIDGKHYGALDNFFHSLSWSLPSIRNCWHEVVGKYANLHLTDNRISLLIDHTKKSKEGKRMPGVRKICQESETQSKPEFIHGYMFGGLSVVAFRLGKPDSIVALPLILQLQSGISHMVSWLDMCCDTCNDATMKSVNQMKRALNELAISTESSITQMISLACTSAQMLKHDTNIIADRAFLTLKALNTIDDHNKSKTYKVTIVTRCKKNLAVYTMPHLRPSGKRGPTPKKGSRLYFDKLFDLDEDELRNAIDSDNEAIYWTQKEIIMYGKVENVKYVALNLIWAKAHCRLLRFVLVKYGDVESILVTTDLLMDAETVIRLYCTREKIETTFRELNQRVNAFSSRFWTKAMPKLNHFRKKTDPDPLEEVTSVEGRKKVALTVRAIELYGAISCIAMGLIQIISLSFEWKKSDFGWQRTSVNIDRPSEECVQEYLRKRIGGKIIKNSNNKIGQLLHSFLDQYELEDAEKIMLTA